MPPYTTSKVDSTTQKANLLNQRLSVPIMRSRHGFKIWLAYMNTWYDLNIDHVQFNCVSNAELLAAQREPEKHQDLIIRVSGFSPRGSASAATGPGWAASGKE